MKNNEGEQRCRSAWIDQPPPLDRRCPPPRHLRRRRRCSCCWCRKKKKRIRVICTSAVLGGNGFSINPLAPVRKTRGNIGAGQPGSISRRLLAAAARVPATGAGAAAAAAAAVAAPCHSPSPPHPRRRAEVRMFTKYASAVLRGQRFYRSAWIAQPPPLDRSAPPPASGSLSSPLDLSHPRRRRCSSRCWRRCRHRCRRQELGEGSTTCAAQVRATPPAAGPLRSAQLSYCHPLRTPSRRPSNPGRF